MSVLIAKSLSERPPKVLGGLQSFPLWAGDGQTAPYCLLLRPESPCRRGPPDLAIETAFWRFTCPRMGLDIQTRLDWLGIPLGVHCSQPDLSNVTG